MIRKSVRDLCDHFFSDLILGEVRVKNPEFQETLGQRIEALLREMEPVHAHDGDCSCPHANPSQAGHVLSCPKAEPRGEGMSLAEAVKIGNASAPEGMVLSGAGVAVAALATKKKCERPTVVCLCGSTRFWRAYLDWYSRLTDEGKIVLTVGRVVARSEGELGSEKKKALNELHLRKIDLADEVLVLDVGGYVGASTKGEIDYVHVHGKPVYYLSREHPEYVEPEEPEFLRSLQRKDDENTHANDPVAAAAVRLAEALDERDSLVAANPLDAIEDRGGWATRVAGLLMAYRAALKAAKR